jgi:RNA polymerase sigma-70 factor, ECF subfamily
MPNACLRDEMLAAIPSMRGYAISLTSNIDIADDLVQGAIERAWRNLDRFQPGTSMNAWLFTILRNGFYSHHRKSRHEIADSDGMYAAQLLTAPEQDAKVDFTDFQKALARLPVDQREALILVGAQGLSHGEAAKVCGVTLGTIKSRVFRARVRLAELLTFEDAHDIGAHRLNACRSSGRAVASTVQSGRC